MRRDDYRSRPHVSIPYGGTPTPPPFPPSPGPSPWAFEAQTPYPFEAMSSRPYHEYPYRGQETLSNPWDNPPPNPAHGRRRLQSMVDMPPSYRAASPSLNGGGFVAFPEPQLFRSESERPSLQPPNTIEHRRSHNDLNEIALRFRNDPSTTSFTSGISSYYPNDESDHYASGSGESSHDVTDFSQELSNLSLDSEEGLRRFQAGELPEVEQEWHRLVPPEARETLGKQEVQRQSVIFELFKAEREYVSDLEAVRDVFIEPLRKASPQIIRDSAVEGFITDVFGNLLQVLAHHKEMLGSLFERQRDQHPLIQSVADIILDTTLKSDFRSAYDVYIKHYPLAESHHRKELKRNHSYQSFVQSVSADPRIRKRDLITFLSRPVTRLPRLNLLLEQILKLTDKEYEHPDQETLPIILGILSDCIKSTQPGIEAAESKVKFWGLCESLIFQKGEIINMDLYDESRTLIYSGPVSRYARSDTSGWSGWTDLTASLIDNFFILTRDETAPNNSTKRRLMSRPIPLLYLRLGSFSAVPETRKERADDGRMLESLRYHTVSLYPFTIFHASSRSTRRYTLYVTTEALRKRWHSALVDAIGVHKVRHDANLWFEPKSLTDEFFRMVGTKIPYNTGVRFSGRVSCATSFTSGGRKFIAVGCSTGIYVSDRGTEKYRKVLNYPNPTAIVALQTVGNKTFNKFIIHFETSIVSYSLDVLAQLALGKTQAKTLDATFEAIAGQDANVLFFRHVVIEQRVLLVYACKRRLQVPTLHVVEAVNVSDIAMTPNRARPSTALLFRPFGEAGYIPKDAYDITPLIKTIGICTEDGIVIADPTNLAKSAVSLVPDLSGASTNLAMTNLKTRIQDAKPLGMVRVDASELLVIYDVLGCYITKHGIPSRSSGYIRWETKAKHFAYRGANVLLFSSEYVEIRNTTTGQIVQVIEGRDIRLLYSGFTSTKEDTVLVAMRGEKDDAYGISDKIVELVETSEIAVPTPASAAPAVWDEWDM